MAPLTRSRAAQPGDVPTPLMAGYYRQRATAGLIVSEGTQISPEGKGYGMTPGIHSPEQIAGWRRVTEAVHAEGGRIVAQLWHVGRISHEALQPGGRPPVGPTDRAAESRTYVDATMGMVPTSRPRALESSEMPRVIADFRQAAANASEAGFDGVEIHGANGYLLEQFLRDGTNLRTDDWGGSLAGRLRLPLAVAEACCEQLGAGRVGYRISPTAASGDRVDSDPAATYAALAEGLGRLGIAFLHVVEAFRGSPRDDAVLDPIRRAFPGPWIGNGTYTAELARQRHAEGRLDAVAFGELFIANPDLPRRIHLGAPLREPDRDTYYGGGAAGYVDQPALTEAEIRELEGTAGAE
jgi:N-ethylmaleimide reductase